MPTQSPKLETVLYDKIFAEFENSLSVYKNSYVWTPEGQQAERSNDTFWRSVPPIMYSRDGVDQTGNFSDVTLLSIPITMNIYKSVPFSIELSASRDPRTLQQAADAARQRLASDVDVAILNVISVNANNFIKRTGAASGWDDIAQAETLFDAQGVPKEGRILGLTSGTYLTMAGNLGPTASSQRSFGSKISDEALRKAYLGDIASFETFRMDYGLTKAAALGGGGLTINTLAAGGNVYVPRARSAATSGEASNVDNRKQVVTVSSTTNVAVGDAFTIAGVNAVHAITKGDSGVLRSFRVTAVLSSTTMEISPPLISAQGGTDAELQYQNCVVNTPSATSAIVFLNTATSAINPFWVKNGLEVICGRFPKVDGLGTMDYTMENGGLQIRMYREPSIDNLRMKYRLDTFFGVSLTQPSQAGVFMFNQP